MKMLFRCCLLLAVSLCGLTACGGEDEPIPPVDDKAESTVLVYMAADNNLSSFVSEDFEEMKAGMASVGEHVNLLVYMDTGNSPQLIELKLVNGQVKENVIKKYESRNSVGVTETKDVFNDVFNSTVYKAERYGLVYWSHGDGWIPYPLLTASKAETRWIGQDTGNGDNRMNLSDFVSVLEEAPHFDFILMDACFVSSVEVAYALRKYTDYYLGSPTETPGPGAPYDKIVPMMFAEDNSAVKIGEAYFSTYNDKYDEGNHISNTNWTGGVSICVIKTDALENLAAATKTALQEAEDVPLAQLRESVFNYDKRNASNAGYFDMAGIMQKVLDESAYATWHQTFETTIAYWATSPQNYSQYVHMFSMEGTNGISHYIPKTGTSTADVAYRSTAWYVDAGLSSLGW